MDAIRIINIRKSILGHRVLRGVSLTVARPEALSLVGDVGCGSTAFLDALVHPKTCDAGSILLERDGEVSAALPRVAPVAAVHASRISVKAAIARAMPGRRVFGSLSLPPIGDLITWGGRSDAAKRLGSIAAQLGMEHVLSERVDALSDDERALLSIAVALVREPDALALNVMGQGERVAHKMVARAADIARRFQISLFYASDTPAIATALGHKMAIMRGGRILQVGAADAVYFDPDNLDSARLAGVPDTNILHGALDDLGHLRILGPTFDRLRTPYGEKVLVGVLPETVAIVPEAKGQLCGEIRTRDTVGTHTRFKVEVEGAGQFLEVTATMPCGTELETGRRVGLRFDPNTLLVFRHSGSRLRLAQLPPLDQTVPSIDQAVEGAETVFDAPRVHGE